MALGLNDKPANRRFSVKLRKYSFEHIDLCWGAFGCKDTRSRALKITGKIMQTFRCFFIF